MEISFIEVAILIIPAIGIILYRPWLGVVGLFSLQPFLASGSVGFTLIETVYLLIFVISLVSWLIKHLTSRRLHLPKSSLTLYVMIFVSYLLATVLITPQRGIPLQYWFQQWDTFASLLLIFPIFSEYRNKRRLTILVITFLTASTLIAVFGISRTLTDFGPLVQYASVGIPSTAYVWASVVILGLLGYVKGNSWWVFLLTLLAVNIFRMVLDVTRLPVASIILGLVVLSGVILFKESFRAVVKLRFMKLAFCIAFILTLIIAFASQFVTQVVDAYSQRLSLASIERGLTNRYLRAAHELDVWITAPVFGVGFGYDLAESEEGAYMNNRGQGIGPAHNLFIYLLSRSGFIGLVLYLLVLSRILKEGWQAIHRSRGFYQGLAVGLFAFCLTFVVFAMFSSRADRLEAQSLLALAGGTFLLLNLRAGETEVAYSP